MSYAKWLGKEILWVEAEHKSRDQRQQQLVRHGHRMVVLGDGRQVLNRLRAEAPPDLIVIDPLTPHLNGKEFRQVQLLDPRLARVPVLVLGGPEACVAIPEAAGFVPKVADAAELLRAIEHFAQPRKPGILVVEDHSDLLLMLEKALIYFGFVPRLAADGQVAIDMFRRERASIDVVLLDVQMAPPDGPQTLAALKQIDPDVRAVFMSGFAGRYATEDLLARGAARVFTKPFELAKLSEELWQLLVGPDAVAKPA